MGAAIQELESATMPSAASDKSDADESGDLTKEEILEAVVDTGSCRKAGTELKMQWGDVSKVIQAPGSAEIMEAIKQKKQQQKQQRASQEVSISRS